MACPVTIRGTPYPSIRAAATASSMSARHLHRHLARYGHLDLLGLEVPRPRPDRRKPVRFGQWAFESQSHAAAVLGLDRKTIRNAARGAPAARNTVLAALMRREAGRITA